MVQSSENSTFLFFSQCPRSVDILACEDFLLDFIIGDVAILDLLEVNIGDLADFLLNTGELGDELMTGWTRLDRLEPELVCMLSELALVSSNISVLLLLVV